MGTLKGKSVFKGIGWHHTDLAVEIKKKRSAAPPRKMCADVCRMHCSDLELSFLQRCTKSSQKIVKLYFFLLYIDPCLFFSLSLPVLQGRSVRSTSTGLRLHSRRWCWTGRPARASWGPVGWWTASSRRSTPSSSRLMTAARALVAPRARSHTSEWKLAEADTLHKFLWGFPPKRILGCRVCCNPKTRVTCAKERGAENDRNIIFHNWYWGSLRWIMHHAGFLSFVLYSCLI